ncbi:hypothetical protein HPT29_018450 [Microvirga terrae]|uniref:Uncharacterized protein n=1 Tax=Microvirga terrae TaxID=2740529 RepID=A0ABY5RQ77_9HYPH|nr:hypothetical protein [Microvirga terrae]UVF18454.1 hypothetical protein HPT29_018450 [Microvirga terrae]
MRNIAKIITAILAALATVTWQLVDGAWKLVRSLVVPQPPQVLEVEIPVSQAEAIAEAFTEAHDKAKAQTRGHESVTHRFPLGYAVAMAARGYEEHLVDVPDEIAAWALALTPAEKSALSRFASDQIEAHLNSAKPLPGVPTFRTRFEQTVAMLDHNIGEADVEAMELVEPIYPGAPRFA